MRNDAFFYTDYVTGGVSDIQDGKSEPKSKTLKYLKFQRRSKRDVKKAKKALFRGPFYALKEAK